MAIEKWKSENAFCNKKNIGIIDVPIFITFLTS